MFTVFDILAEAVGCDLAPSTGRDAAILLQELFPIITIVAQTFGVFWGVCERRFWASKR